MFETIVALATPPMKSALAIIRLSGDDCFEIVSKCFSKDITKIEKKTILVGDVKDGEDVIDEVVLLAYVAPKSFTGENSVEIISHGSMLIVSEIINLLIKNGARKAERGEFSNRAFINRKMDLIEAEAVNDLINAETKEAKNLSLLALKGETSELIRPLAKSLMDLIANAEVSIDYPEYQDIKEVSQEEILKYINNTMPKIDKLIENGEKGRIITSGVNVALVGKPNVGKSSLLNAILKQDKAIVTDIAGTTRDVVEGEINLDGLIVRFYDTAGIRESTDKIENIGINKSLETINKSDLAVAVFDPSDLNKDDEDILNFIKDKKHLIIYNKLDIFGKNKTDAIYVSALNREISPLIDELKNIFGVANMNFINPSLTNARQIGLLKSAKEFLLRAKEDALNNLPIDLLITSLYSAHKKLIKILGEDNDVDVSKEIFTRFCVGK
ncbi:MAG: tRNA uridine-5-carboxymethylaminomethyl(34) synthesis GTPase MnmE [Erysipelotrichaceae bacterium]|jgi:tRNA modification GTPase|nr:tRNA uridine-5-carboxymethylaminomethyl(34) synthesis GTPase MnmE [Erysipelotrichaceae bacterium]